MSQARVLVFGVAAVYLFGTVVSFFLAGLATFGATTYGSHRVLGWILMVLALSLVVLAVAGKLPKTIVVLALVLLVLNVLQSVLVRIDVDEISALHLVNALVIVFLAHAVMQRSRRDLASRLPAS